MRYLMLNLIGIKKIDFKNSCKLDLKVPNSCGLFEV